MTKQTNTGMKRKKIRKGQPITNRLKKFKVLYLNIRGIKSKISTLNDIIDEVTPTIFCVTETHLIDDDAIEIENYKILRNNRNNDGGGVLIGVDKRLRVLRVLHNSQVYNHLCKLQNK